MTRVDTVVIGAGHAGLAVSHLLDRAGRDHVVLDRGRVAERWRSERWDSLHLLTPRWMTRLPDWRYMGSDQDGFMSSQELVRHLEQYAASSPVELGVAVCDVSVSGDGYRVATDSRSWQARQVVIATGTTEQPQLPPTIERLDPDICLVTSSQYRNPTRLPSGGVLVVGASASGTQIADELVRSGRRVVLATGRHNRMPRRYRGMDIFWWLDQTGRLSRTLGDVRDVDAARREPSLQLSGRPARDPGGTEVDLLSLQAAGVELVGRVDWIDGRHLGLRADLATTIQLADVRMHRFLDAIDRYVDSNRLTAEMEPAVRPTPVTARPTPTRLDLRAEGIGTVLLATGYRPHHPWLRVPVIGRGGVVDQVRGVTPAPGLYVVGQRFQYRRDSTLIDGARHDAHDVVSHICTGRMTIPTVLEAS
jgi:putative flavoprotein involved in K+ transport